MTIYAMRKAVFLCIHGQYVIHGSGLQAVLELSEQASERVSETDLLENKV